MNLELFENMTIGTLLKHRIDGECRFVALAVSPDTLSPPFCPAEVSMRIWDEWESRANILVSFGNGSRKWVHAENLITRGQGNPRSSWNLDRGRGETQERGGLV